MQSAPELLRALKLPTVKNRQAGRFLLAGLAQLPALPQIGDSLTDRMEILIFFVTHSHICWYNSNFYAFMINK